MRSINNTRLFSTQPIDRPAASQTFGLFMVADWPAANQRPRSPESAGKNTCSTFCLIYCRDVIVLNRCRLHFIHRSGPVQSGPVRSSPVQSGLVWSGPVQSGPVWSGPVRSTGTGQWLPVSLTLYWRFFWKSNCNVDFVLGENGRF